MPFNAPAFFFRHLFHILETFSVEGFFNMGNNKSHTVPDSDNREGGYWVKAESQYSRKSYCPRYPYKLGMTFWANQVSCTENLILYPHYSSTVLNVQLHAVNTCWGRCKLCDCGRSGLCVRAMQASIQCILIEIDPTYHSCEQISRLWISRKWSYAF